MSYLGYGLTYNEGYMPHSLYREMCDLYHASQRPMGCFVATGGSLYHVDIVYDAVYWQRIRDL